MASGIYTIVTMQNEQRRILSKGKTWQRNMYIDNPFYSDHINGNDITQLITNLKNNNNVYISHITDYVSDKGTVNVSEMYGLRNVDPLCCFIKNKAGIVKLMTIPSRLPCEFAAIGHNSSNQCIVPVIILKKDDGYKAVNIL